MLSPRSRRVHRHVHADLHRRRRRHRQPAQDIVAVALANGLAIGIMVSNLGHISGGHFNPAITLGFLATRRITPPLAVVYWVAQFARRRRRRRSSSADLSRSRCVKLGAVPHAATSTAGKGSSSRSILTFFLVWAVWATAVDPRGAFKAIAGLAIGLTITIDVLMGGPLTGAAMNPARAFGPELAGNSGPSWWIYWIGPIVGASRAWLYEYLYLRRRPRSSARRSRASTSRGPATQRLLALSERDVGLHGLRSRAPVRARPCRSGAAEDALARRDPDGVAAGRVRSTCGVRQYVASRARSRRGARARSRPRRADVLLVLDEVAGERGGCDDERRRAVELRASFSPATAFSAASVRAEHAEAPRLGHVMRRREARGREDLEQRLARHRLRPERLVRPPAPASSSRLTRGARRRRPSRRRA